MLVARLATFHDLLNLTPAAVYKFGSYKLEVIPESLYDDKEVNSNAVFQFQVNTVIKTSFFTNWCFYLLL